MVFLNVKNEPLRFYKFCMNAIGVWPLEKHTRWSKVAFSITISTQVLIILMCLTHPLDECLPVVIRSNHTGRLLVTIHGVFCQICVRLHGRSMVSLIKTTIKDWSSTTTKPNERIIMERHDRAGTFASCILLAFLEVAGFVQYFEGLPVIDEFIITDKEESCDNVSPKVVLFLSQISYAFCALSSTIDFLLFWSFAVHLSGQYKILKMQFEDFLQLKGKQASRMEFRRLIRRHNELNSSSCSLDDSFTPIVTLEVIFIQLFICVNLFAEDIDIDLLSVESFIRISYAVATVSTLYMYYYAGDYLTTCSKEIGQVLIQCNWYDLSKESIADFSIVIARSQKPVSLTVAKMYKLNLSNLKHVYGALYSYMSCIIGLENAARK